MTKIIVKDIDKIKYDKPRSMLGRITRGVMDAYGQEYAKESGGEVGFFDDLGVNNNREICIKIIKDFANKEEKND